MSYNSKNWIIVATCKTHF